MQGEAHPGLHVLTELNASLLPSRKCWSFKETTKEESLPENYEGEMFHHPGPSAGWEVETGKEPADPS